MIDELSEELYDENREFSPIPIGAVIDTPASAIMCHRLAKEKEADFLIINTKKILSCLDLNNAGKDAEDENIIAKDAFEHLLKDISDIFRCKNESQTDVNSKIEKNLSSEKIIVSLGKNPDRDIIKTALNLGFSAFSVSPDSIANAKMSISQL